MTRVQLNLVAVTLGCVAARSAYASDFSFFLYLFWGISAIAAAVLALIAYFVTRKAKSLFFKALIWGSWWALVLTPAIGDGFNGTMHATPIVAFVSCAFGADIQYALAALTALAISLPLWVGLIYYIVRDTRKQASDGA